MTSEEIDPEVFNQRFASWLRIEPRCRSDDFSRGLEARTADPLWMLARQWQMGEFIGEDAGSPIRIDVSYQTEKIDEVELGQTSVPYDIVNTMPLEALVERECIDIDWRIRIQIGQQFERLVRSKFGETADAIIRTFRESFPIFNTSEDVDHSTQRFIRLMAGRCVNGETLLLHMFSTLSGLENFPGTIQGCQSKMENILPLDHIANIYNSLSILIMELVISGDLRTFYSGLFNDLNIWFKEIYSYYLEDFFVYNYSQFKHGISDSWQPHKLSYQLNVNSTNCKGVKTELIAPEYRNGDLDWYTFSILHHNEIKSINNTQSKDIPHQHFNFDKVPAKRMPTSKYKYIDISHTIIRPTTKTESFLPTRVSFGGMPHARWWAFEDNRTDFGDLDVAKTDLAKLMIMEFALVYGDDWFMVPLELPIGSLTKIKSIEITNVFGEKKKILPPTVTNENPLNRWEMFTLAHQGKPPLSSGENVLFIPPVVSHREESPPIEEVRFLRDEGANMVWAVEHTVANGLGDPVSGFEAQLEKRERVKEMSMHNGRVEDTNTESDPVPQYKLATSVPTNWIPFIPVQLNIGSIQLKRAQMLYVEEDKYLFSLDYEGYSQHLNEGPLDEALRKEFEHNQELLTENASLSKIDDNTWEIDDDDKYKIVTKGNELLIYDDNPLSLIPPKTRLLKTYGKNIGINEESVPRAGLKVQLTKQRVRWVDGKTYVWLGRKILTGRGEGRSGLRFDVLKEEGD